MIKLKKYLYLASLVTSFVLFLNVFFSHSLYTSAQAQSVINLTQTGCQFVETEAQNYNYQPQSPSDCNKINSQTLSDRQKSFKTMNLSAGKYIFRVKNVNVPYELSFYLRGQGASQVFLPKVSGGGLEQGMTKEYAVELKKGKYYISCPLNPTPDYALVVQ